MTLDKCRSVDTRCKFDIFHSGISKNHVKIEKLLEYSINLTVSNFPQSTWGLNTRFCLVAEYRRYSLFRSDFSYKILKDGFHTLIAYLLDFTKEASSGIGAFIKLFEYLRFVRIKFARPFPMFTGVQELSSGKDISSQFSCQNLFFWRFRLFSGLVNYNLL